MKRSAAEAIGHGDLGKPVKTDGAYELGLLAQRMDEMRRQLHSQYAVAAVIGSTLRLDEVYAEFAARVRDLVPFDRLSLVLRDDDGHTVLVAYTIGLGAERITPGTRRPLAGSVYAQAFQTGQPAIHADLRALGPHQLGATEQQLLAKGIRARATVPFAKGTVTGALNLWSTQPGIYTPQNLGPIIALAPLVAAAVDNARMYGRLEQAEARMGAILDAMPDACVIVDGDGRIVRVNTQTERLFGYEQEELLGRPVERLLPERFRGRHVQHRASYRSAPRPRPMGTNLDLYARRKDGSEFPVEVSLSPLETAEGPLVISAIRDVTVRKQAEQALEQSNRELERSNAELAQFASVVSHDLRSPLSSIAGFSQLLEQHYVDHLDAKAARYLTGIMDGARHMQTLIDGVLAYAQVGAQAPPPEPVDCTVVVERAVANLRTVIEERGALVTHGDLPTVAADATQLSEVFQNLIGNAIKYCHETPQVAISAHRDGAEWLFSVRDNGIGLDPAEAERIFGIFQRAHAATEYPGTGIGLAICKRVIERHGGRIWAESCVGDGTTFKFTLPALEADV